MWVRGALYNQDDLMALRVAAGVDKLKPGITGWAQINGRDEISIAEKVGFEKEYLEKKSFWFDVVIVVKTFTSVLGSKGGGALGYFFLKRETRAEEFWFFVLG